MENNRRFVTAMQGYLELPGNIGHQYGRALDVAEAEGWTNHIEDRGAPQGNKAGLQS